MGRIPDTARSLPTAGAKMPRRISCEGKPMKKRQRVLLAATAVASIAALTACGSGGGGGQNSGADADFTAAPTGTLNAWGFENADDVGQSRLDYAAEQLSDVDIKDRKSVV